MADENVVATGPQYGFTDDTESKANSFNFGLNHGTLKKCEWINNGGKDGAEGEAMDIIFLINGTEKGWRQFPVVKAFDKSNNEVTDPNAPEFKEAVKELGQRMTHLLHCFHDLETIKAALSRPTTSFKEFMKLVESLLPKNFSEVPLDIFMHYQWQLGSGNDRTYLEIPKKVGNYGKFLVKSDGLKYKALKKENPDDNDKAALVYVAYEDDGITVKSYHPFARNGWYMNSKFANQQKDESAADNTANVASTAPAANNVAPSAAATSW